VDAPRSPWKIYTSCNIHVLTSGKGLPPRARGGNLPSREEIILYTLKGNPLRPFSQQKTLFFAASHVLVVLGFSNRWTNGFPQRGVRRRFRQLKGNCRPSRWTDAAPFKNFRANVSKDSSSKTQRNARRVHFNNYREAMSSRVHGK